MVSQISTPVDRPKHLEDDNRGSGRIETILYGSTCPQLNRANPANLAPDEKKSKGYRDGLKSVQTQSLHNDPDYSVGWTIGYAERQRNQLLEEGLAIVYGSEDLAKVLSGLTLWQSRKQPDEVVELRYFTDERRYTLCVSVSLFDRELPF